MTTNTDILERVGKRMPYTVPEGFFESVEERVMTRTVKRSRIRPLLFRVAAAAACIGLIIGLGTTSGHAETTDFSDVAQAFDSMSEADQDYFLETMQNDYFSYPGDELDQNLYIDYE